MAGKDEIKKLDGEMRPKQVVIPSETEGEEKLDNGEKLRSAMVTENEWADHTI